MTKDRVRAAVEAIENRDETLGKELKDTRAKRAAREEAESVAGVELESMTEGPQVAESDLMLETIVLRTGRPVLAIQRNETQLVFQDADSEVWRDRLKQAKEKLTAGIRAVGRIELENNPRFDWVGTGWLVAPDIVVTNRHVAMEFGRQGNQGFVFRPGADGRFMNASIDFLEELGREESLTFQLSKILHIESEDGPDLAFLRVKGKDLASHISLSTVPIRDKQQVAVIGYPARDSRIPDVQLMDRIFGDVYNKKRLAPGQLIGNASGNVRHDCSTLGGNSGSVVLDLETGQAVAAHFAGRFLEANFGVPAAMIADRLHRIERGESPESSRTSVTSTASTQSRVPPASGATAISGATVVSGVAASVSASGDAKTWIIPLRITVDIGTPASIEPSAAQLRTSVTTTPAQEEDEDLVIVEAVPEDYRGRKGYVRTFLGNNFAVDLPSVVRNASQVLNFELDGKQETELRYEHFSVVMNSVRRMCFFSAVNINGKESRKAPRSGWRFDPRIDNKLQIMKECYGNAPKFSRGHMTRREDPIWGSESSATLGNDDSMHVTNVVPQMQSFNAGIWLGLEDYALDHARQDDMKISVFTGPILRSNDPVRHGVKIPRSFWKVIAFKHDQTGELCATGYSLSQEDFLREEEFVFGQHKTTQRALSWIEQQAGVSFGSLTALDRFGEEEGVEAPLTDFSQIRFF
jgi:endonuclease G